MAETKKTCFIIMPITTPDNFVEIYRDGKEHFKHVLECLFIPAVEKAGFEPIPPIAKGSDLIHAEIIKNLETSDLVLCDMSCLNPNVFFEYGIRTALNKPVCVTKDEHTKKVPFDTSILNYQEYKSTLETWEINSEIENMSKHTIASFERSKLENTLWKYFGVKMEAKPLDGKIDLESKIDLLTYSIESIKNIINERNETSWDEERESIYKFKVQQEIINIIGTHLKDKIEDVKFNVGPKNVGIILKKEIDFETKLLIIDKISKTTGFNVMWGIINGR